jgi:hypothetical protein
LFHTAEDAKKMYACDIDDVSTWTEPAMLSCHVGKNVTPAVKKENMRGSGERRSNKSKDTVAAESEVKQAKVEKLPPNDNMFKAIQRTFQGDLMMLESFA